MLVVGPLELYYLIPERGQLRVGLGKLSPQLLDSVLLLLVARLQLTDFALRIRQLLMEFSHLTFELVVVIILYDQLINKVNEKATYEGIIYC